MDAQGIRIRNYHRDTPRPRPGAGLGRAENARFRRRALFCAGRHAEVVVCAMRPIDLTFVHFIHPLSGGKYVGRRVARMGHCMISNPTAVVGAVTDTRLFESRNMALYCRRKVSPKRIRINALHNQAQLCQSLAA